MAARGTGIPELVCERDMGVFEPEVRERYEMLTREVIGQVKGMKELDDGYALQVGGESESILKVAEWVSLERRCCTFFKFALELEPGGGPVWLHLTGGPGVREFLQSEIATRKSG